MTATQMLTAGLNAALRRPVVSGARLREELIKRGVIQPRGRWEYVPSPNRGKALLVWTRT